MRTALAAVLALAAAPDGFTVTDLTAKVRAMTGQTQPTTPPGKPPTTCASSAANSLVAKPGADPPLPRPGPAARTIAALLALRDQVIAPILAGVRSPSAEDRKPAKLDRRRPRL